MPSHPISQGSRSLESNDNNDDDDENDRNHKQRKCAILILSTMRQSDGQKSVGQAAMIKSVVLIVLCLQNSVFTLLRRYSLGILQEGYSKHEVLLLSEVIKMVFSAGVISKSLPENTTLKQHLRYLTQKSGKMAVLALIYGLMNILSFVSLQNIGAGIFTIFAQCKILTTALCSTMMLRRRYSWARWRALFALMLGVLLFSEPIWNTGEASVREGGNAVVGVVAVLIEVTLSGFASIYFEKVIKNDPEQLGIWERNFQLALGSFPIYFAFIIYDDPDFDSAGAGWSPVALTLSLLGAAGGLLVALSIKYADAILKTLAVTGAIVVSSVLDHYMLGGPLTPFMMIAGAQVIIAICNYTFDSTPVGDTASPKESTSSGKPIVDDEEMAPLTKK
mmetsp:Transcript_7855/g.11440  ORF Transcript_7855/g.11440 Transcript_7855/m.11440 type:complete len:391 (+) Transcript_7855:97-1269(+)